MIKLAWQLFLICFFYSFFMGGGQNIINEFVIQQPKTLRRKLVVGFKAWLPAFYFFLALGALVYLVMWFIFPLFGLPQALFKTL